MSLKKKLGGSEKKHLHRLGLQNIRSARCRWGVSSEQVRLLTALTEEFQLSVALGDLSLLDGKWYVTHSGLLRWRGEIDVPASKFTRCANFLHSLSARWVFCATVYKSPASKRFVGYGDADPSQRLPVGPGS